jgi:phosphate-selective porin OprO and OprP
MPAWGLALAIVLCLPNAAATQQPDSAVATTPGKKSGGGTSRWRLLHANELETPWTTFRIGGAILPEIISFNQNAASRSQVAQIQAGSPAPDPTPVDPADSRLPSARSSFARRTAVAVGTAQVADSNDAGELPTQGRIRDSRFVFSGRLATKRNINWSAGVMYDWIAHKWFIRQTGFLIDVPEIYSNFWVGRTKEGPSLNRVTSGYDLWMMERFTFSDAGIPLLADGVRWQGYIPKYHLIWNLGGFIDVLSKGESFSYFSNQVAGRVGYVQMDSARAGNLFHAGLSFQFGIPTNGSLALKSKPEAFEAPQFINTGKFPATAAQLVGIELYRRTGSWLYGTEYYVERATSPETSNPVFSGGDVFATWLMTGETRSYVAPGSVFSTVSPKRSVFDGGPGAIEWLLRLSNIDLTAGTLQGGTFWRITPGMNWYLSSNVRLAFEYGYGALTRFGTTGATQFFQSRLQLQL